MCIKEWHKLIWREVSILCVVTCRTRCLITWSHEFCTSCYLLEWVKCILVIIICPFQIIRSVWDFHNKKSYLVFETRAFHSRSIILCKILLVNNFIVMFIWTQTEEKEKKHTNSSQRFEDTMNLKFGNPITLMDNTIRCNSSFTTFFSKNLNRMKLWKGRSGTNSNLI